MRLFAPDSLSPYRTCFLEGCFAMMRLDDQLCWEPACTYQIKASYEECSASAAPLMACLTSVVHFPILQSMNTPYPSSPIYFARPTLYSMSVRDGSAARCPADLSLYLLQIADRHYLSRSALNISKLHTDVIADNFYLPQNVLALLASGGECIYI